MSQQNNFSSRMTLGVLALVAVLSIGANIYFSSQIKTLKQNPQEVAQENVDKLLVEVSKLMVLPEGESPNVVTVADLEPLKDQPFFKNATVGDKLLIYTTSRKAVLYNPTQNKIVEVAPLIIGENQGGAAATSTR